MLPLFLRQCLGCCLGIFRQFVRLLLKLSAYCLFSSGQFFLSPSRLGGWKAFQSCLLIFIIFLQVKRPESSVKTLAVLLPCREKGSKTTKIWLRRLQQYLYYHHKGGRSQSQGKSIQIRLSLVMHSDKAGQFWLSENVYAPFQQDIHMIKEHTSGFPNIVCMQPFNDMFSFLRNFIRNSVCCLAWNPGL